MQVDEQGSNLSPEAQPPTASEVRKVARKASKRSAAAPGSIKADFEAAQSSFEKDFETESLKGEVEYTHLRGIRDHYRHKSIWSYFLMFLMLLMLVFQCALLGLVGAKFWDFKDYTWLLPALLVQNLAQIVGLAIFVVKSLFKDLKSL